MVRDGRRGTAYLNGDAEPEVTGQLPAVPFQADAPPFIGGRSDSVCSFEGKIDEAAVYARTLTAPEPARHHAAATRPAVPQQPIVVPHTHRRPPRTNH